MEKQQFNHWSEIKYLKDIVTNPLISVGDYSYFSGYYENYSFENGCVRYLWGDAESQELFNPIKDNGWQVDRLLIGNYVCIASGAVILMGGNHNHHSEWVTVYPFAEMIKDSYLSKGDTIIESDVWIGMNAFIMPGVKIGEGAIIASNSVITKDVPPYTVVGGNPGKEIKKRFSDREIVLLKEMRWFDWPREKVESAIPLLSSSDIDGLYAYYQQHVIERV